ncbi:hypothetical protein HK099_005149 [Clydaea vesicula]|uniref:pyridoxal 5'-phosphate synthase n=1 Tax=Clydaea vesicula TaxID=447962 RepID=A0AAD5XYR2_9FUNG|nr:hypothetical protein HK099_005149 [Clydaea vesicula]KAJ3395345.1 hypothetical protein HDU92_006001 [Lobulomyces angularis]
MLKKKGDEPNAVTLSTCGKDLKPSSRVILLKSFSDDGFVFFTNYNSKKSRDLMENPNCCLNFYWNLPGGLVKSVRIEGSAVKLSEKLSIDYFKTRPRESQIGAWASAHQSSVLKGGREEMMSNLETARNMFANESIDIPKPDFWGGYNINPTKIEFWQGGFGRMHDRLVYSKDSEEWILERFSP